MALTLFDVTGRAVATLVNARREAGEHVVAWNAQAKMKQHLFRGADRGQSAGNYKTRGVEIACVCADKSSSKEFRSRCLTGNPLGDDPVRETPVSARRLFEVARLSVARRTLGLHRQRTYAYQLERLARTVSRAYRTADQQRRHSTMRCPHAGLLHAAWRRAVYQLLGDRRLRRLSLR